MTGSNHDASELAKYLDNQDIAEQIGHLAGLFPGQVAFSSSLGPEDQVITDIIARNNLPVRIFTIDTGRLFPETYELLDRTRARYKTRIEVYFPQAEAVQQLLTEKGATSFYESVENRQECCHIRKVEPLNRALENVRVWITGIRGDQSDNRHNMSPLEWVEKRQLFKFNPLLHWTFADVQQYVQDHHVPVNPLHAKGFVSIGCAPCTRAIEPGEDERSGRWWWEQSQKECGLHKS
jgi:phosphoadenosine phosphosulfate reductase